MKRFTSLLIGCSLALAGAAMAQQPEQQSSPTKKKQQQQAAERTNAQRGPARTEKGGKQTGQMGQRGAMNQPGAATEQSPTKGRKGRAARESANTGAGTNVSGQPGASVTPSAQQQQTEPGRKGKKGRAANAERAASPATAPAGATGGVSATPAAASAGRSAQQTAGANAAGKVKKPDPQQVQQIKQQHTNFRAQPKPQQVPAVTYNQNYRIQGAESWTGPQYEVFRSYHPEWHDQGWYRSRFGRVEQIGGGYYYFNNGYWYPAWGYDPGVAYYAYDGPIYVGHRAEPPDRVIADVQAELQQMGYYRGEVDGLLGPLTREALTAYQADQGLTQTAAIDEPTLDSLGMS